MSIGVSVHAVVRQLIGGALVLVQGDRPSDPDVRPAGGRILGRLMIDEGAVSMSAGGRAEIGPIEGRAERAGRVRWFQAQTTAGDPVFSGDVGTDESADLLLTRTAVNAGDEIVIERIEIRTR